MQMVILSLVANHQNAIELYLEAASPVSSKTYEALLPSRLCKKCA